MIIQKTKLPQNHQILQDLQYQFTAYSVYPFDSRPQKSIIIRKSALVGAQVTIRGKEVLIDACYPNVFVSAIMSILTASTIVPFNAWVDIERKVADFFRTQY